jgi:hypothetical protein
MSEPKEPGYPPGAVPHRERVSRINNLLKERMTAAICIDNDEEHKAWYLHELKKYPRLTIVSQGVFFSTGVYIIKVRKGPSNN